MNEDLRCLREPILSTQRLAFSKLSTKFLQLAVCLSEHQNNPTMSRKLQHGDTAPLAWQAPLHAPGR